jgi:nitrogen fixation protein FixH
MNHTTTATFPAGKLIEITYAVTDRQGDALDPATLSLVLRRPTGEVQTYVYGEDAAVQKTAPGAYVATLVETDHHRYHYEWRATFSIGEDVATGTFMIEGSKVD